MHFTRIVGTVLIGWLAVGASVISAAEPQVAFELKKGWVELVVKKDGRPIADALIEIIDEQGKAFADGQTAADGQAAFPLPRGSWCTVEIKTGDRTADPIRLFKVEERIEPSHVLLSYGLRPCCRFVKAKNEAVAEILPEPTVPPADSLPDWAWYGGAFVGLSLATVLFFAMKR